jgi:hypothetical protein
MTEEDAYISIGEKRMILRLLEILHNNLLTKSREPREQLNNLTQHTTNQKAF